MCVLVMLAIELGITILADERMLYLLQFAVMMRWLGPRAVAPVTYRLSDGISSLRTDHWRHT
jgi:hypothetical protein